MSGTIGDARKREFDLSHIESFREHIPDGQKSVVIRRQDGTALVYSCFDADELDARDAALVAAIKAERDRLAGIVARVKAVRDGWTPPLESRQHVGLRREDCPCAWCEFWVDLDAALSDQEDE